MWSSLYCSTISLASTILFHHCPKLRFPLKFLAWIFHTCTTFSCYATYLHPSCELEFLLRSADFCALSFGVHEAGVHSIHPKLSLNPKLYPQLSFILLVFGLCQSWTLANLRKLLRSLLRVLTGFWRRIYSVVSNRARIWLRAWCGGDECTIGNSESRDSKLKPHIWILYLQTKHLREVLQWLV